MAVHQQVGVNRCQETEFKGVVTGHGVATLTALTAKGIGLAVGENVEVNTTLLIIEEPTVVEARAFPCKAEIIVIIVIYTSHDVVGENALLLLPPRLAVMPYQAVELFAFFAGPLHHVVPTTALVIATSRGDGIGNLVGKLFVAFFRLEALHPREVPGNLQVVTNYAAGLMNTPAEVMAPVVVELLVHERAVTIVREVFANSVKSILKEVGVLLLFCCQVEVDQIGRCVVTDRVPVFLGFVDPKRIRLGIKGNWINV